eukprot:357182-Chlamydomonas_euryale.AAC.5
MTLSVLPQNQNPSKRSNVAFCGALGSTAPPGYWSHTRRGAPHHNTCPTLSHMPDTPADPSPPPPAGAPSKGPHRRGVQAGRRRWCGHRHARGAGGDVCAAAGERDRGAGVWVQKVWTPRSHT